MESSLAEMSHAGDTSSSSGAWKTVTYAKKQKKAPAKPDGKAQANGSASGKVFRSLEKEAEERRKRLEAQRAAVIESGDEAVVRSGDDDGDSDGDMAVVENGSGVEKKVKAKKPKVKKVKVTVAEAAGKIVADDLASFLAEIAVSFEAQHGIQLMRFADYFGRAFSAVPASEFPWIKLFRESAVPKIADIPVNHISEDVYKTSVDWISKQPLAELQTFIIWGLDSILVDLANQQGSIKGSKKSVQPSSKSQVAIFVVLAMVLRRKPDALIGTLPTLRDTSKYQGQDKLPVIIWMIVQACHGDICVGLYAWAHNLLPMVVSKSCNPQSRDLILQLVERILSGPKARTILLNGAAKKGERVLPPVAFDVLMRVTFPASSARLKATERFEAIYPTLKEVALAGSSGSKAMKQVSQEIITYAVKAAGEGNSELSKEATSVFIWCLTENPDCYKQWCKIYSESAAASVAVLRKIAQGWAEFSAKQSSHDALREAVKSFRDQNEKALASEEDHARQSLFKEADNYCKLILAKLSRSNGCVTCVKFLGLAMIATGVGIIVMGPTIESLDSNKLSELFTEKFEWEKVSAFFTEKFEWEKLSAFFTEKFEWDKLSELFAEKIN